MAKSYQDSRSAQLEGPAALKGLKLARFSGREAISRPFEYHLALFGSGTAGSDGALDSDAILGQSVTVGLVTGGTGGTRYFNGIVTEFEHLGYGERFHEYRAVLRPSLWLLTRRADYRIFQKKSTPDIFADVCQQAGSIPHRLALGGSYEPWEYRVQYRESDFDFVSRLLEHEGIYYYFEHSAGKHELVLTDDVGKLSSVTGYDEVPYFPPTTAHTQRDRDHLASWTVSKSFQPAAFASVDYNFETPAAIARALVSRDEPERRVPLRDFRVSRRCRGAHCGGSGAARQITRRAALRNAERCSQCGDAAGLGAGRLFKLKGHPRTALNKKYLIVATVCELTSDTAQTGAAAADAAPQFALSLDAVEADAPYRPERVTPKPVIQGTQTARVVGPSGKEIWTDKYGRVKVQFHWDRVGKADDNSSCWVRVAQSWAGKNWGGQHVPRVGQEVVVSFLEGDPDRPLVIGSVYNAEQMPPYDLPTNGTRSGVKSRSSVGGTAENSNELRFEDKKDAEEIYLHAEKDLQVVVKNNQATTVGKDLTVSVTGTETRTVTKDRTTTAQQNDKLDVAKQFTLTAGDQLTLECGLAKIVLKKDGSVEISGKDLKLSGTQSAAVDATQASISGTQLSLTGTKTAIQGSGTLDLSSGGIASLKGSLTKIG